MTVIAGDFLSGQKDKGKDEMTPEEFEKETSDDVRELDGAVIIETPIKSKELPSMLRVKQELFSIEMFREEIREIISDPRGYLKSRKGHVPPWIAFISLGLFMVVGIIVFSSNITVPCGICSHYHVYVNAGGTSGCCNCTPRTPQTGKSDKCSWHSYSEGSMRRCFTRYYSWIAHNIYTV